MEEWRDIIGYEGIYQVSNLGRVRRLKLYYKIVNSICNLTREYDGYLRINLTKDKKHKKYPVHRLVAKAFIPNSENKPIINHLNGIRDDNRVANLEWVTHSENHRHAFRVLGKKHNKPTPPRPVIAIFNGNETIFPSIKEAAKLGFHESCISRCARGLQKKHKHVVWRFV